MHGGAYGVGRSICLFSTEADVKKYSQSIENKAYYEHLEIHTLHPHHTV